MKGKILGDGVISADDGKRYSFEISDFKSGGNLKVGDEVDFIIQDEKAKEIYLLQSSFNLSNLSKFFEFGDDIEGIRNLGIIGAFVSLFIVIPFFGSVFSFVGFILILLAIIKTSNISGSTALKSNYIQSIIFIFFGTLVVYSGVAIYYLGLILGILFIIVGVVGVGFGLYKYYLTYKELSTLSENKLFLYQVWIYIAGYLTTPFLIGYIVLLVAAFVNLYAWIEFKKLNKAG